MKFQACWTRRNPTPTMFYFLQLTIQTMCSLISLTMWTVFGSFVTLVTDRILWEHEQGILDQAWENEQTALALESMGHKRMSFGKFKGFKLKNIPCDYWEWLTKNADLKRKHPDYAKYYEEKYK